MLDGLLGELLNRHAAIQSRRTHRDPTPVAADALVVHLQVRDAGLVGVLGADFLLAHCKNAAQ